jgi:DNA-binding response OmpR family regulator
LLVIGPLAEETSRLVHEAAAEVGTPVASVRRGEEIAGALHGVHPLAFLIRMDAPGAAHACAHVRSQARLAQIPVFGAATTLNDLAFAELFALGGDDLILLSSPAPILARLRTLRSRGEPPASRPAASPPAAVVAGPGAEWRSVMGRALSNGGFAVRFATTAKDLANEYRSRDVRVVVAADDLEPEGGVDALRSARAGGSACAWILVAPPRRMAEAHAAVTALSPASILDGFAPPENVLFVANELLAARGVDNRASPRLLYGTAVAFRPAGRSEDEVGFSYNVSASGAFVRTLAPPEAGHEVWLETWVPRSERRVRLAGRVAWKRVFGPLGGATVPPGFGVQLVDGLLEDLGRWTSGCSTLAEALLGTGADGGTR